MAPNRCPQQEQLSDYLLGRMDDVSAETVDAHVASCTLCQTLLAAGGPQQDALISALKQELGEGEFDHEPELRSALDRAGDMRVGTTADEREASGMRAVTECHGTQIGQYRLLELLGEGGMGSVYKAEHSRLEMIVAVKILADHLTNDPQAVARFDREMKAVGTVSHPNIVRATDAGEDDGQHYLAMEFVDGRDLSQLIQARGALRINDACEVIRQAAIGMQHAHDNGLIHRDLKPSNLMVTRDGNVKVLDLGLARLHKQSTGESLTADFQVMGTADYMAPEQALKAKEVDERADIYSLGCTLYALLCGRPPFSDERHDSSLRKLMAHDQEQPTSVTARRMEVPTELSAIVDRTLAKSPEDRFASAHELADSLRPFTMGADLPALCSAPTENSLLPGNTSDMSKHLATADTLTSIKAGRQLLKRPAMRPRRWLIAATAVAVLGIGALATMIIQFKTSAGTIVVQIEGDLIGTEVEGERLLITDRNSATNYYLSISGDKALQSLTPGNYSIQVENEASGLRLETDEFQITRKNQTVVKAYLKRPAPTRGVIADGSVATPATGEWQDILEMVPLSGHWRRTSEGVLQAPPTENQVLTIPVDVDGGYQLRTSFTRRSGENSVNYYFPVGDHIGVLYLDIGDTNSLVIDGKAAGDSPVVRKNVPIETGRRYAVAIDVGLDGDQATIAVDLDGQRHLTWSGGRIRLLTNHPSGRFSIGSRDGDTVFHELLLKATHQ